MNLESIPQDLEAEKTLIGACLLSGKEAMDEIQLTGTAEGLFWDVRCAELWRRMERLTNEGKRLDLNSIAKVKVSLDISRHDIDQMEIEALPVSCLRSFLPGALDARKRRDAIFAMQTALSSAQDLTRTTDTVIDEAEQALFAARFKIDPDGSIKESLSEAIGDWESAHATQGRHTGVDSGFRDLDHLTWGFQPRNLIIIAARPSQGKTAMLCNIAENCCIGAKVPTLIFSLEMTRKELLKRIVCSMARVSSSDMRAGQWSERDFPKVTGSMGKITRSPLTIIDKANLTINQMRTIARRHVAKNGVKLVLVDYLQKVRSNAKHEKRTYEVGEVSTGLKEMAKEISCPVVAACQLNRESEKDKDRPPRLSDLGDSGMIERDADIVGMLYRREIGDGVSTYQLIVNKHRDGPCGSVHLVYIKSFTRFESASRFDDGPRQPHND